MNQILPASCSVTPADAMTAAPVASYRLAFCERGAGAAFSFEAATSGDVMATETRRQYIRRRRTELFILQLGKCHWCKQPMRRTEIGKPSGKRPFDECTLDHLFDRHHPMRRVNREGATRYVASCHLCNQMRGMLTDSLARMKAAGALGREQPAAGASLGAQRIQNSFKSTGTPP